MVKRFVFGLLLLLVVLAGVLVFNTVRMGSRQVAVPPLPAIEVDKAAVAASLAEAVKAKTVSGLLDPAGTAVALDALAAHLQARYPRVHAALQREVVGDHSLLFTWRGRDAAAKPIALMAHQDVVPVAPGTESLWARPPFDGVVEGGYVWGRGALDDKSNVVTQLEAVERLLAAGFQPERTVLLVFGHDEEVGGGEGAVKVVELLKQRGVRLEFVVDEGGLIGEGLLPGLNAPLALIGLAEKGILELKLTAKAPPGHSSMPPTTPGTSAVGMLAAALDRLDHAPLPGGISGVGAEMFAAVAPELPLAQRVPLANLWLFRPLVERMLSKSASTNAMLRSTVAMTMLNAGNKSNVLPGEASAVLNLRLLPGDSSAQVTEAVRRAVADERIEVRPIGTAAEASRVSRADSPAFALLARTVREVFPGVVVAPNLMVAGTDSRHFEAIADDVYRFMPIRFRPEDLPRLHGTDERIAVDQLADMVRFYHRLISQAAGARGAAPGASPNAAKAPQ